MALSTDNIEKLKSVIAQAEANGESPEWIQSNLIPQFKAKYDVATQQQPQSTQPQAQAPEQKTIGRKVADALFTEQANDLPNGSGPLKAGIQTLGLLGLPARAVGALAGQGSVSDAETNILRKPAQTLERGVSYEPKRNTLGEVVKSGTVNAIGSLGRMAVESIGDPLTYVGAGTVRKAAQRMANPQEYALKQAMKQGEKMVAKSVAKASGKAGVSRLSGQNGFLAIGPGEQRPGEVPDIDEIAKDIVPSNEANAPLAQAKNMRQIQKGLGPTPKKGITNLGVSDAEAKFLDIPEPPNETPFPEVMKRAKDGADGVYTGKSSAMDKAGEIAVEAHGKIQAMRRRTGEALSKAIDDESANQLENGYLIDGQTIKNKANELLKAYVGGMIDPKTKKIVKVPGSEINTPNVAIAQNIMNKLDGLDPYLTSKEAWDVNKYITTLIKKYKSKPGAIDSNVQAMGDELSGIIDSVVKESGGAKTKALFERYARLRKIDEQLGRRLGEISDEAIDPQTGERVKRAFHGASLLKSAIMSNSDRNSKALFEGVRQLTGVDLFREAAKAEIAMKAVGDPRINDLLKAVGDIRGTIAAAATPVGATAKALQIVGKTATGSKADQLLRYYNKAQGKNVPLLRRAGDKLRDQSGSVGGVAENPQIHSQNFKQWFGDWQKAPENASKVVDESGKPLVVYHGTKQDFSAFDKNNAGTSGLAKTGKNKVMFFTDNSNNASFYADNVADRGRKESIDNLRKKVLQANETLDKLKGEEKASFVINVLRPLKSEMDKAIYAPSHTNFGGQNVKPVFLDIKNPIVFDVKGRVTTNTETVRKLIKQAKDMGHDGIVLRNVRDFHPDSPTYTHYVAFNQNQIKSATGNSGAFSPTNPDIRGSGALPMLGATGATALGALTIGEMVNRKANKKRGK